MRLIFSLLIIFFLVFNGASAQDLTDSNLPIVVIRTDNGVEIPDNPRVLATMKIISNTNGERNYLWDQDNPSKLTYNGRIEIELRGSSSQVPEKKQYGLSTLLGDNVTNNNVMLLGLPAEHDWILNGMSWDTALIRDYLSYTLSRRIGEYASRTVYCEVVINNDFRGLYLLQEKIKADNNRVNVHKILAADNAPPDVTGGYITKADKTTGGDPVAWNMQADYIHVLPKPEEVTPAQDVYIYNQFRSLANTSLNGNSSLTDGFPKYIDIPSFIDYMIIQELSSNCDAYQFSTYFHKDRNGKLRAGPLWDNDLTYGNDLFLWGYDRSKTDVWQFSNGDNTGSDFWRYLFGNDVFRCYLSKRWNELIQPGQPLNLTSIDALIDETVLNISEAVNRDYSRWGIYTDFQARIQVIRDFLQLRIPWISTNLGPYTGCLNVPVPPLVITKIMYNPPTQMSFPDSDKQEFIEITNNGDDKVNLTGDYFGGTGFVFQFPENSYLWPHSSIFLANNSSVFQKKYGFTPFGQFTRNLSNTGQDLLLVDGYGNVIDDVSYTDTIPWPDADGNGLYLKLKDLSDDNSIPSNWIASNDKLFEDIDIPEDLRMIVFPNPVDDIVTIQNGKEIISVSLYDISGRRLSMIQVNSKTLDLDLRSYPAGIYLIRAVTANGVVTGKIVKR